MPDYTVHEIAVVIGAGVSNPAPGEHQLIRHLLTDSRQVTDSRHTLFFAIRTERNDGHRYIGQLLTAGVRAFVVETIPADPEIASKGTFLIVNNPLRALQKLVAFHRSKFSLPVIGITGSNGKTIVKEWITQLLTSREVVAASPKSYNSQIGVPLSVWQLNSGHTLGVFEAGISAPGEMEHLEPVIQPTIGLITNIGQAHSAGFKSAAEKTAEKFTLFRHCKTLIYCNDHKIIEAYAQSSGLTRAMTIFTWGRTPGADLLVEEIEKSDTGTNINYRLKNENSGTNNTLRRYFIPFSDSASIENSLHCRALLHVLGVSPGAADQAMEHLPAIEMRLELREGINNCSLINDSYSNDLNSLTVALDFLNQQKQHNSRSVILSDILQSGRDEKLLYADVASLMKAREVKRFIGIGAALCRNKDLFSSNAAFYSSTEEFLHEFDPDKFDRETILIKGARSFGFEKIVRKLEQKNHETVLETNLAALIHNLNFFRSKLNPGVKTTAMVKAFSYGSGSFEIANALQFHHIDYLAVAYADEGYELRRAGITTPIMVMNPENTAAASLIAYRLEPEVYSIPQLTRLVKSLRETNPGEVLKIHLKTETGMHRLGIAESDIDELAGLLTSGSHLITVASVFSHLAGSDEPELDSFTREQIATFDRLTTKIINRLGYAPLRHILNSSGITRFPDAQYDMVRLGIGLYGISPFDDVQHNLQNVNTLKSHISQIKMVDTGGSVGYNRRFIAQKPTRIGIVPVGYADGLSRSLGNSHYHVTVNGQKVPIIGNICMDMCIIDLTRLSDVKEGDAVVFFDDAGTVSEMAQLMGTIPYEVLTGISRRVKRVYFEE